MSKKSLASEDNGLTNSGTNSLGKRVKKKKKFADEEVGKGQSDKLQHKLSVNSETSKPHTNINSKLPSRGSLVKLEIPKEGSKLQARTPNTLSTARPLTSAQRSLKGSRSPSKTDPKVAKTKRRAREKARLEMSRRENSEARTLVTPQNNNTLSLNSTSSKHFSVAEPAPANVELSPASSLCLAALIGSTPSSREIDLELPVIDCDNAVRHLYFTDMCP